MTNTQRDRLLLALVWLFSLPSVAPLFAYRALLAHQAATFNRLDNINFFGGPGLLLLVWFCYVTQGTASGTALALTLLRDATVFRKIHAWLVAAAGWFLLYYLFHPNIFSFLKTQKVLVTLDS